MSKIQGVVGSIDIEQSGDILRINVTYGNGEGNYIVTDPQRVQKLWLPALSAGEFDRRRLDTEGSGVEIIKKNKLTYISPKWSGANPDGSQAIFDRSQVKQIKKALK